MNSPTGKKLEISSINSHINSNLLDSREVSIIFALLEQSINQKCNCIVKGNKMLITVFKKDSINFNDKVKPVNKMKLKLQTLLSNKKSLIL